MAREPMAEVMNYICPTCGADAQVGTPCPGCTKRSSLHRRAWEQRRSLDGLDLPDESFDYEDFVEREFGRGMQARTGLTWYWWLLGVASLAAVAAWVFGIR